MEAFKKQFLDSCSAAAEEAGHIFPTMAASEAGLESRFGTSGLAIADFNLFGMKQHQHPEYETVNLPTREFINSDWVVVDAPFIKYPTLAACFADRMATLKRLAPCKGFEHYKAALEATDAAVYVTQVSLKWSTDPERGNKVIDIENEYLAEGK